MIDLLKTEALHVNLRGLISGEVPLEQIAEDLTYYAIVTDAEVADPDTDVSIISRAKLEDLYRLVRLVSQLYVKKDVADDDPIWSRIKELIDLP